MSETTKPRSLVVDDKFVWNSPDPEVGEVRIPLKFKGKILKAAKSMQGDDLEFMFYVLREVGVPDEVTDEMDAGEINAMFKAWQLAWNDRNEATYPEASGSSN